jgi:hypothetical protein
MSIPDLVVEAGLLSAAQVAALLMPEALISPRELLKFGTLTEAARNTES